MTQGRLQELLQPFVADFACAPSSLPEDLYAKLSVYFDLLLRWNARTNLTAIRDPEEIVTRHFGEGLFTAAHLWQHLTPASTLLDLGSGAGFPGLPIQLALPSLPVTLAESQGKKAAFLREAVRVLGLSTEVWAGRVEAMPAARSFQIVTLRAVDRMQDAVDVAVTRILPGGFLAELAGHAAPTPATLVPFTPSVPIPGSSNRLLRLWSSAV